MSDPDAIPLRPRARTFTPVRVLLAGVLLLAVGFIGGVEVQKRSSSSGSGTGGGVTPAARFAGRFGGAARGAAGLGAGGSGGGTVGQVANVHGRTLYVTGSGGTTVKVKTSAATKVTRDAVSRARAIHPGDSVVVQGSTSRNGTVKASRVSATAANAGGFGG